MYLEWDNDGVEFHKVAAEMAEKWTAIMGNLVAAYMAETGAKASEIVIVEERLRNRTRWWLEKGANNDNSGIT
jgi:hypothetical protein